MIREEYRGCKENGQKRHGQVESVKWLSVKSQTVTMQ